jgi:signal transduction histidine kinase
VGVAAIVGVLSRRLLELERQQAQVERDLRDAHALRTPIATIHGLVSVLGDGADRAATAPLLRAISAETDALLRSGLFESLSEETRRSSGTRQG